MVPQIALTHQQHKVPRWHLRNFADANGKLWCYRRGLPAKPRSPKSVCWEQDFYEYEVNGRATRNMYERWFGRIENDAAQTCHGLLDSFQLGQWDAVVWATYVASLFIRSSKCRGHIVSAMTPKFREETRNLDFIRNLQHDLLKKGILAPADEIRQLVESRRANMENSAAYYHLAAIRETVSSVAESLMKNKTWHVIQAPTDHAFLIGDHPVTTFEFVGAQILHGAGFNRENSVILLPLTPQRVFVASPRHVQWSQIIPPQAVASVNLLSIRFAQDVVLSNVNAPATQALVNSELNQIVFGRDAFIPAA
jgi:hypothetical protein